MLADPLLAYGVKRLTRTKNLIMPQQLVFATNNRHKLDEVSAKIGDQFKLLTLDDIGCTADIEETGTDLPQKTPR
jgi:predicted phosphatase